MRTLSPTVMSPSTAAPDPIDHVVADRRVTLLALQRGSTQSDALVDRHAVPDDGRAADHDARSMVDEESLADRGTRMDVDAGHAVDHVAQEARQQRDAAPPQRMDDAMRGEGVKARIRKEDVEPAIGRRIALDRRTQVGEERRERRTHGIASYEPARTSGGFCGWIVWKGSPPGPCTIGSSPRP